MNKKEILIYLKNTLQDINYLFENIEKGSPNIKTLEIETLNKKIADLYEKTIELRRFESISEPMKVVEEVIEEKAVVEKPVKKDEVFISEEKLIEAKAEDHIELKEPVLEIKEEVEVELIEEPEQPKEEIIEKKASFVIETEEIEEEAVEEKPEVVEEAKEDKAGLFSQEDKKEETVIEESKESLFDENELISTEKKSIHEKYAKSEPSLHEKLASAKKEGIADKVQKGPITDIKSAISLNLRISFIKDLFQGDQKEYKKMVDFLAKCKNYSEAKMFITGEKEKRAYWNEKQDLVDTLMELLERRFRS